MKTAKNKSSGIPFTDQDARVFQDLFDALEDVYGEGAQGYMRQYVKLWPHRLLLFRRFCELTAEGIEQQFADQQRAWKLLLEEENRAAIERLATCKIPTVFETELAANAMKNL